MVVAPTVQAAWARGQPLAVHGLVYSLHDGLLQEVTRPIACAADVDAAAADADAAAAAGDVTHALLGEASSTHRWFTDATAAAEAEEVAAAKEVADAAEAAEEAAASPLACCGGTRREGGGLRALPFLSPHPLSFFIHFFSSNYIPCVLCVPHGGRVWFDSSAIQRKSRARDFYFLHHPPSTRALFFFCSIYHQRNARWEALSFPTQASTTCACVPVMQT